MMPLQKKRERKRDERAEKIAMMRIGLIVGIFVLFFCRRPERMFSFLLRNILLKAANTLE